MTKGIGKKIVPTCRERYIINSKSVTRRHSPLSFLLPRVYFLPHSPIPTFSFPTSSIQYSPLSTQYPALPYSPLSFSSHRPLPTIHFPPSHLFHSVLIPHHSVLSTFFLLPTSHSPLSFPSHVPHSTAHIFPSHFPRIPS